MSETKHCVFTDLPPPGNEKLPAEVEAKRCFGNNCSEYTMGASHCCPTGRCQRFEDAIIAHAKAGGLQDDQA